MRPAECISMFNLYSTSLLTLHYIDTRRSTLPLTPAESLLVSIGPTRSLCTLPTSSSVSSNHSFFSY